MSVLIFELTQEHINLVKQLNWGVNGEFITTQKTAEHTSSFETTSNYEGIDLVLNGVRDLTEDCFDDECYSEEEKTKMNELFNQLPIAIDIIMFTGKFEVGKYKTKYHIRDWKKIK